MTGFGWALAAVAWLTAITAIAAFTRWAGKRRGQGDREALKRRAGGQPGPGADPVDQAYDSIPRDDATWDKPRHGGVRRRIDVYADGRTEITRYPAGGTEIIPGNCPACAPAWLGQDPDEWLKGLTS